MFNIIRLNIINMSSISLFLIKLQEEHAKRWISNTRGNTNSNEVSSNHMGYMGINS